MYDAASDKIFSAVGVKTTSSGSDYIISLTKFSSNLSSMADVQIGEAEPVPSIGPKGMTEIIGG